MKTSTTRQTTAGLKQPDRLASDEKQQSDMLKPQSQQERLWPHTLFFAGEHVI